MRAERKAGEISKKIDKAPGARTDRQPLPTVGRGSTKQEAHAGLPRALRIGCGDFFNSRNAGIAGMLRSGMSWTAIQEATIAKVRARAA
jgi:hypothetical protein